MKNSLSKRGFTLIEMLVVVAIVGILTAVAVSAYSQYVISSRLPGAFSGLTGLAQSLETYRQDNSTYVGACQPGTAAPLPSADGFTFSCPTLTASSYVIQAQGVVGTNTAGFTFTLDSQGGQATPTAPAGWPTSATCWVRSKSGSCS